MSNKVVVRKLEILVSEQAPFDIQVIGAAILEAVKPLTGLPVMVSIDPVASSTSIELPEGYECFPRSLVEMLAQSAEQHQGEPVGEVVAFGEGLHEIAWVQGKMPRLGAKLYTRPAPADPGEVERLRSQLRLAGVATEMAVHEAVGRAATDYLGAALERDALRAQLAERDALLTDILKRHWSGVDFDLPADLVVRIKSLSASAEPIPFPGYPPVPEDRKLPAEPSAPKCGVLAGEPEVIGERCADGGKCHHGCASACARKESCAPLGSSGLTADWSVPKGSACSMCQGLQVVRLIVGQPPHAADGGEGPCPKCSVPASHTPGAAIVDAWQAREGGAL